MNYRDIISKSILKEELTDKDLKNNEKSITSAISFLNNIDDKSLCFLYEDENSSTIYETEESDTGFGPNNDIIFKYKSVTLTYDNSYSMIACNIQQNGLDRIPNINNNIIESISKKYNVARISLDSAKRFGFQLINKFKISNNIKNNNLKTEDDLSAIQELILQNRLDTIKTKQENISDKEISTSLTKSKDSSEYHKKKTIAFGPTELIGDDLYRSVQGAKEKAERSILDFEKQESENNNTNSILPQEIAAAIIYKELQASVSNNPSQTTIISQDELRNIKNKGKIDYNSKVNPTKKTGTAKKGFFGSNTYGKEVLKMLTTNPVEVLSPIVFCKMKVPKEKWSVDEYGISSKKIIDNLYCKGNDSIIDALIKYPPARNEKLIDSLIAIPTGNNGFSHLGISTKGGENGHGAAASVVSIFNFLLDDQNVKNHQYSKMILNSSTKTRVDLERNVWLFLSRYCKKLFKGEELNVFFRNFKEALKLIVLIGGVKPIEHEKMINVFSDGKQTIDDFAKWVNEETTFSRCLMRILDLQKYDFAQVNCLPSFSGDTFKYDYSIQYPAKFTGSANLEIASPTSGKYKYLKFHIMG